MDNENNISEYNKAPPESPEIANTEDITNKVEEAAEKAENMVNLSEVAARNETDTIEITDSEEEKSNANRSLYENDKSSKKAKKKRFNILGKIAGWLITILVFLSVFLITGYYVTTASKAEFHADCTDTIMWANASVESGHLYDQDFKYACFLPIGTSTIMIPLIQLFGLSIKTHIIGMTIFFILFTLFMVLMMREVTGSLPSALSSRLIAEDAIDALKSQLLPVAAVVTPNIPEAEILADLKIASREDMVKAAEKIGKKYGCAVLCKGGHSLNDANDLLWNNGSCIWFNGKRINNPNTHGTGCTLSSAIASNLAKGFKLEKSVERAKDYISGALAAMLDLGKGSGPMNHAFALEGEFAKTSEQ